MGSPHDRPAATDEVPPVKNAFDLSHPFFLPLWRRVVTVAISAGWALLELAMGNTGWAAIFGAIAAYAVYGLFIAFDAEAARAQKGPGQDG